MFIAREKSVSCKNVNKTSRPNSLILFDRPLSFVSFRRSVFIDFADLLRLLSADWKYPSSLPVACCGDRTRIDGVTGASSWLEPSSRELITARGSGTDRWRCLANDIRRWRAVGCSTHVPTATNWYKKLSYRWHAARRRHDCTRTQVCPYTRRLRTHWRQFPVKYSLSSWPN